MSDSLYVDGAKIGTAIGAVVKRVRDVAENVRAYVNGIEDAAKVASKGDADDGNRRDDD